MNKIDPSNPFADMDESDFEQELLRDTPPANDSAHVKDIGNIEVPGFIEKCGKCRGTGNWRIGYPCFACKGTGKLQFKTSPEARAKARSRSAQKVQATAKAKEIEWAKWLEAGNPAVKDWLKDNVGNSFADSLTTAGIRYGSLTEGQVNAVLKAVARDDDQKIGFAEWCKQFDADVLGWLTKETENGNEFAGSLLDAGNRFGSLTERQLAVVMSNISDGGDDAPESQVDLSDLVKGYYAVPNGETRLKIAIRRPGKNSRWYGWTFVDDGATYGNRRTYGKQAPDGLYAGSIQKELLEVLSNPLEAMVAYGKLTGTCGKCGRVLEDEESVAAGIGPICATKM